MGQDIARTAFASRDFARFAERLSAETALLESCLRDGRFDRSAYVGGFELEAWLLDRNYFPMPANERYLALLGNPLVVPELSKFNVELNGTPQPLAGAALSRLERELTGTWRECLRVAHELGGTLIMTGILPTLREQDLDLENMSPLKRYVALNEQILARRGGAPIALDIRGREHLTTSHSNVMLEAATTSFQVHFQAPADAAVRYFNAAQILSGPLVALAANSPFLFGKSLWEETRIALFEQAVDTDDAHPERRRVTFGSGYLQDAGLDYFRDNLERFDVLLPISFEDAPDRYAHLRLHNGTIWRWNRLLVGFDERNMPHLRVEQRVMPAGPTIVDMIANAAVYIGASRCLAGRSQAPESSLAFADARENFYRAARDGLDAPLVWLSGKRASAADLLREEIIPMAREGLRQLGADVSDVDRYLAVASARVRSRQNGAAWQRAHAAKYGRDFFRLTADYLEHQRSAMPVHEWGV